jgi:hypothetical protein
MATTMSTNWGFKRIPAELRNQIYEDFITNCAEHRFIKLGKLDEAACKTPWELALALGLNKPFFPLLFASKQIMAFLLKVVSVLEAIIRSLYFAIVVASLVSEVTHRNKIETSIENLHSLHSLHNLRIRRKLTLRQLIIRERR